MEAFRDEGSDSARLERLRGDRPALEREVYLNNGTFGPLPRSSGEAMRATLEHELGMGRIGPDYYRHSQELREEARSLLARRFGTAVDEIALTPRTTDGLDIALWGIAWQRGDEILTTRDEHPGLLMPLAALARRTGVRVSFVDTPEDPSARAWLDAFASRQTPQTKALAFSHVLWTNGERLPLEELGQWARGEGLLTVVDAAQAAGAVAVDLHRSQVDFYALPGQKWLLGPEGTGALYVAESRQAQCQPTFVGYLSGTLSDNHAAHFQPAAGARRYEIGSPSQSQLAGLVASLRWQEETGPAWATERIGRLGQELAGALAGLRGVELRTRIAERMSGIVSFEVQGKSAEEASAELARRGFRVRHLPPPHSAVRVSCGFYTLRDELGRFVEAVREVAVG